MIMMKESLTFMIYLDKDESYQSTSGDPCALGLVGEGQRICVAGPSPM